MRDGSSPIVSHPGHWFIGGFLLNIGSLHFPSNWPGKISFLVSPLKTLKKTKKKKMMKMNLVLHHLNYQEPEPARQEQNLRNSADLMRVESRVVAHVHQVLSHN